MALFKCKMCGGDLEIVEGASIAECEYCGTKQTVPKAIDENLQNLFNRANTLRIKSEFDKAEKLYEKIIQADSTQSEAYWGLILCKYGIEYVDDPATFKKVPTCHRASFESIVADDDYKSALENADMSQRAIYEEHAKEIDRIQKDILALAQKEENYDVFICYKETGADGRRTQDSVIANDIYHQLTQEGFKVFYAAITLEGKLGSAYEPIIFAALNSAKVMLVIGTKPEYFNAVWVKNEWSRYLKIIKNDRSKLLIPCYRDMDAYELPEEFAHLQAQDMSKIGFINDVVRGIKKVIVKEETKTVIKETVVTTSSANTAPLIKRIFIFLADKKWEEADTYCEKVLDIDPENPQAYLGKLMVEFKVSEPNDLKACGTNVLSSLNYERASKYSEDKDDELWNLLFNIEESIWVQQCDKTFLSLKKLFDSAQSEIAFSTLSKKFEELSHEPAADLSTNYQEILRLIDVCNEKAAQAKQKRLDDTYYQANVLYNKAKTENEYKEAARLFASIKYKDSDEIVEKCLKNAEIARKDAILLEAKSEMAKDTIVSYENAIKVFKSITGWKDSDEQVSICQTKIVELKAKAEEEKEQKRIATEAAQKKAKKVATICSATVVALFLILILINTLIIPATKFNKAISLMENGKYSEARAILVELDGFSSSESKIAVLNAINTINDGKFEAAIKSVLSASEKINIKYNLNGGTSSNGDYFTYSTSSDYSSLLTPQKEGYRFVEWKLSGYSYSKENSLELVLDAVWSDGYFITYKLDGGTATNPTEYHKDGDAITLNNPTRKGYTFIGWTGTDLTDPTINVTIHAGSYGDREYTANWEAHGKITYNLNGGKATNISEYTFLDADFTLNNPTREGYTFIGWTGTDLDGLTMTVTIPTGSHGNREFTANWQPNQYTFTLNANGGTVSSSSIFADYNASYTLPTPTRDYYTFEGWYDGTKKYADGTWREANNVTLTAKWTPISYTITYNLSGGTNSSQNAKNFTVESSRISLKDPTRKGYKFLGWYKDSSYSNKVTEIVSGSHENISLYAKWEIINYTITYSLNGGTVSGTIETTFTVNDLPLQLPTPSKTGYVFLNWSVDSVDGTSIETITSLNNISIVANYMMEGLSLELSRDKTYYTVNYSGAATHVEIPSYYQGKPVKKIAGFRESLTLESITIPNTIEVIEEYCFYGCVSLASIVIPDSVTVIDSFAFYGCSNLKSLTIGKGLKSIGSYAFEDTEITDLYLNDLASWLNVEFDLLSSHPFDGYSSSKRNLYINGKLTTNLIIPDGVTSIGSDAFNNCTGITSVSIPDSVASIGSGAFSGCDNLTSVSIGSGVTSIGMYAFYDCENLTNVNIPNSVTNIGSRAFYFCENLKKVIIPASVKTIGDYAFSGYYGLEVYCRISTKPIGWNSSWIESSYGGKVVWGYTGD